MPLSVRVDISITSRSGFTLLASFVTASTENGKYGNKSILDTNINSLVKNILGYLLGLSSPSVTAINVTL